MEILADIGGRPGIDCRGFCAYCYFRGAKDVPPFGCKHCMPFQKGCDYCSRSVKEQYPGFKPLPLVVQDVGQTIYFGKGIDKITISGGGDASCYPDLNRLVGILSQHGLPLHLGYTSGKGFDDTSSAEILLKNGVSEVSFTVFATDPGLRRKYMSERNPEVSLRILRELSGSCDVYAAAVILPGVNDGEVLERTCSDLEDMGVKGLILMRFANYKDQGLILGNAPIIEGAGTQSIEEFAKMVKRIGKAYKFRVTGTPLYDTFAGSPFAIIKNKKALSRLPAARKRATVITGRAAAPMLSDIFSKLGGSVNVVAAEKDIGCLITIEDAEKLELDRLAPTVIFPGRAFVHDGEIKKVLSRDGVDRLVRRGPDRLTVDGEMSISLTKKEILDFEVAAFTELISLVNLLGV
ncbi:MAG TPA: methyl coenzyme M reductase-arginine methyltransferase Mmp10 [Candidatus Methanoperedenaceae archaeon]|nr:methyl coenzyme M reductase-arginine methyltransferase Mmp10 [Candidatus Methanoperedenaceae archaeon]